MPGIGFKPFKFDNYYFGNFGEQKIKNTQNPIAAPIEIPFSAGINSKIEAFKEATDSSPVIAFAQKLVKQNLVEKDGKTFEISQGRVEQWCADAVNYIYEKSCGKNPFGVNKDGSYKNSTVFALRNWAIKNSKYQPAKNKAQIDKQLTKMKPGDIIIFKSPFTVKVEGGGNITRHASHTGIVEKVENGKVSVIEGNANVYKKNSKGEYLLVHNEKEGQNGSQAIGDFQKKNPYDGVIVKKYRTSDLIEAGYSGYIEM